MPLLNQITDILNSAKLAYELIQNEQPHFVKISVAAQDFEKLKDVLSDLPKPIIISSLTTQKEHTIVTFM